ncbi:MAG: glycoside hydrolase family 2 protein [Armatimonadota bacterium]
MARRRAFLTVGLVAAAAVWLVGSAVAAPRAEKSLDGPWEFRTDPNDEGERNRWFLGEELYGTNVTVPGCWDAQGVGEPTDRLFHNYVGKAWYRREEVIPEEWEGRRVWIEVGGAHRYMDLWVNGHHVGRQMGYLSPVVADITGLARPGTSAVFAVRVDNEQDWSRDPLTGCFDVIDAVHIAWGGIYRAVRLYTTGQAWIADAFVVPHAQQGEAEVRLTMRGVAVAGLKARVVVRAEGGEGGPASYTAPPVALTGAGEKTATITVLMRGARLWSPESPNLYRATVSLEGEGGSLDEVSVRFGLRDIEIRGNDFYLNGKRLFLRGYGDDCCFPETIAPPADKAVYLKRLRLAKAYGFNYVRHHSHVPLAEYFEAADEVGMMVQPELPIAYMHYFQRATQAGHQLLLDQWRDMIRLHRNHPSVFAWCMGNELWNSFALARQMYADAQELDPSRPVNDSDGVPLGPIRTQANWSRPTLDVFNAQFDEHVLPWGPNKGKYDLGEIEPAAPIVIHEMGNFNAFPDVEERVLYRRGVKPFWLDELTKAAEGKGLTALLPTFVRASRQAQAMCRKVNLEAARRSPQVDGHTLWLLQDYWTGANGLVTQHYQEKGLSAEQFRRFNGPSVLLLDRDECAHWAGDEVELRLLLSHFGDYRGPATLRWRLLGENGQEYRSAQQPVEVGRGGVFELCKLPMKMLEWANRQERLSLDVELHADGLLAANDWPIWVFPREPIPPGPYRVVGLHTRRPSLRFPGFPTLPPDATLRPNDVVVSPWLSERLLAHLEAGGRALLVAPAWPLRTLPAHFENAWWLGNPETDSDLGHLITDHRAVREYPHEGFADLHFFHLMHGRRTMLLDELAPDVEPIIRAVPHPSALRTKAWLFEAGVGRGRLLATTLNLSARALKERPEAGTLFDLLVRYLAAEKPVELAPLDAEVLRKWMRQWPVPLDAPFAEGYQELVEATSEAEPYTSPRGQDDGYVVRQLDGTHEVTWRTAPVPRGVSRVTFVWLAGLGWLTEPAGGHFDLALDGEKLLEFDLAEQTAVWQSEDKRSQLVFELRRSVGVDRFGVMYLTVPAPRLRAGEPVELTVTGSANGSRRWFMLYDVTDSVGFVTED